MTPISTRVTVQSAVSTEALIHGLRTYIADLEAGDALALDMASPLGELPMDARQWANYPTGAYRLERIAYLGQPGPGEIPDEAFDRRA